MFGIVQDPRIAQWEAMTALNQRIQRSAKCVAIFAKQKYAPHLPHADAYR